MTIILLIAVENIFDPSFFFINIGLVITLFIAYTMRCLNFLYLFQIKEYRSDRIRGYMKEFGLWKSVIKVEVHRPRLSVRNLFIMGVVLVEITCIILGIFVIEIDPSWRTLFMLFFLYSLPWLSCILVAIPTAITVFPIYVYKTLMIYRARGRIRRVRPIVIGITGSYGKSMAKDYIATVLSAHYPTAKTDANQNTDIGIALSILKNVKPDTKYFVMEVGAYTRGEIAAICAKIKPHIGVITAIGNQHLQLFGTKTKLLHAKGEIFEAVQKNSDKMTKNGEATSGGAFMSDGIDMMAQGYLLTLTKPVTKYHAYKDDPHKTALAVARAVGHHAGLTDKQIDTAERSIAPPTNMKLQLSAKGYAYLKSTYSTNLEAFILHIHLISHSDKRKKIIVTRGIIELGSDKIPSYEKIIHELPKYNCILFTTDVTFEKVGKKLNGRKKDARIRYFRSDKELFAACIPELNDDTALLIEGRFPPDLLATVV